MPAYDENAKDWFVKWEPAQKRLQVQSCHRLGKIWVAVHMSQALITKLQGLRHAADPIEATNEALSVLKADQFFEGDEAGNLAYEKWYREMSEMKEQGKTKWIVPKVQSSMARSGQDLCRAHPVQDLCGAHPVQDLYGAHPVQDLYGAHPVQDLYGAHPVRHSRPTHPFQHSRARATHPVWHPRASHPVRHSHATHPVRDLCKVHPSHQDRSPLILMNT
ncbi:hypothetical protein EV361DRAFT_574605 [Lentinula raphanica]|nr:hypothetical protein EV361DRAFT_574605 [Lentinula raphanica]